LVVELLEILVVFVEFLQIIEFFEDLIGSDKRFVLETCGTGYEAGLLTASFKPHLMLLDYKLPDINGNEVCKRIRSTDELSNIKVIFISGVIDRAEAEQLLTAGADEFLKKPFDIQELMAVIEKHLGIEALAGGNNTLRNL
ncbi:MAG: hypothetical protein COB69_05495, partial [Phycisphaera sp.]